MVPDPAPLTGLAVGDALGMAFETQPWFSSVLQAWDGKSYTDPRKVGDCIHPMTPGQWTDDTIMSLALSEALLEEHPFNPDYSAKRYLEWYNRGYEGERGMGKATRKALQRLNKGVPRTASGEASEGNGGAMRASVLGIFLRDTPHDDFLSIVEQEVRTTHTTANAIDGAIAIAVAAREALVWGPLYSDLRGILVLASSKLPHGEIRTKILEVLRGSFADASLMDTLIANGTGAHVVQTVPAAYAILAGTGSYAEAVECAIRAGGDTDTTAAIVGSIAGTYYGFEQVQPFLPQLERSDYLREVELKIVKGPR